jgi:hypothetical protein
MGEAKFKDCDSLHIMAPGWAALGILLHDITAPGLTIILEEAAAKIGQINWHRSAPAWAAVVQEKGNVIHGRPGNEAGRPEDRPAVTSPLACRSARGGKCRLAG